MSPARGVRCTGSPPERSQTGPDDPASHARTCRAIRCASSSVGDAASASMSGGVHGAGSSASAGAMTGQSSTMPPWPCRQAVWRSGAPIRVPDGAIPDHAIPDHAVPGRPVGEAAVDRVQHLLDRAEGHVEIDGRPVLARSLHPLAETFADPAEHHGIGALEAEDRLLDVADGEHGARRAGQAVFGRRALGSGAGEKLPRDRLDQAPLLRAGILGLVDQDVVDAAVQLVEHPFGRRLAGQQVLGHQDQVVEIDNGAPALFRLVP